MLMSFEIRDTNMCICTSAPVKHVAHSIGTAHACAKQEIVLELFCIPMATALTGTLNVFAKECSSHARDAVLRERRTGVTGGAQTRAPSLVGGVLTHWTTSP